MIKIYSQQRKQYTYYEIHKDGCGDMIYSQMSFTSPLDTSANQAKQDIQQREPHAYIVIAECAA